MYSKQSNTTMTYRCAFYRRKGYKCQAKLQVIRPQNSQIIRVEESHVQHQHEPSGAGVLHGPMKLTWPAKEFMKKLSEEGRTAQQIRNAMQDKYHVDEQLELADLPSLLQIQNFIARQRVKTATKPTLDELREAVAEQFPAPEDGEVHRPFLVGSDFEQDKFIFIWTTENLLSLAGGQASAHIDATYKIVYAGFPIFVSGFSDADHRFFPIFMALCSNEDTWAFTAFLRTIVQAMGEQTTVIGDGAASITAACTAVLLDEHLERTTDARTFAEWKAWREHWLGTFTPAEGGAVNAEPSPIHGWYEGFGRHVSTNNGLESMNEKLKTRETLRRKLPLLDFLNAARSAVFHWSSCPDHQRVATFPKIEKQHFVEAAALNDERRLILKLRQPAGSFIMPSKLMWPCSQDQLQQMHNKLGQCTYNTWNEFVQAKRSIHIITPHPSTPNLFFCSCFTGCKKNPCKHSVLIMHFVTKTLVNPYQMNPIEPKRKRGRPSLAKHALSLD